MKQDSLEKIKLIVLENNTAGAEEILSDALECGLEPVDIIENGLSLGMKQVGDLFERGDLFLPQVMMAAALMTKCVDFLKDKMPEEEKDKKTIKVVIGTVEGDVHDIGKNIVKVLLSVNGFEVHDVGRDALTKKFIDKAIEIDADIVASSALMTGTMLVMEDIEAALKEAGIRDKVKTIIGGAPVTEYYADKIGANAYAENASEAVNEAMNMIAK
ncbi:MAG: corrinoid protein [Methanolobus sp.]|nr:corrinoid protein [Methanolobus sp.]